MGGMADVKMMGPNELREYAKRGQREHDERDDESDDDTVDSDELDEIIRKWFDKNNL